MFLQSAGWSEEQSFNLNIALSACYIIGGMVCWLMFPHIGRATIYMGGLVFMFCCLIVIGALGFYRSPTTDFAVGIVFVISTLCNMITTGPACYPIVAETPSGKLRYKTISIGRVVYNLTGMVNHILTPRMVLETGESEMPSLSLSATATDENRLGLGCKERSVLRSYEFALPHLVLFPPT